MLRRYKVGGEPLAYADLELNQATREVRRAGHLVELTVQEYRLLLLFMRHPRQVLTREQLLERLCVEKMGLPAASWRSPHAKLQTFTTIIIGPEPFDG